jgi:hypothetical protein
MKKIILLSFVLANAHAQNWNPNQFYGMPIGAGFNSPAMGGGVGGAAGFGYPGSPTFVSEDGDSVPMFDQTGEGSRYNKIRPNASCPLLTQTVKEDQDAFLDIKNYLTNVVKKPECAQGSMGAIYSSQMSGNTIAMLESMLSTSNSNAAKCYTKNVEQISNRNMAYYYAEKGIDQAFGSPYAECNKAESTEAAVEWNVKKCIDEKYQAIVETNRVICKEVVAPQLVQDQINKGIVELERILVQTLSQSGPCAPEAKDAFKATINTFLKVKALSAVGPWGAMAGFGADLIGNLLDRVFPNDSQKASALLEDILSEDNYEQNACLYFNIQQKMYCSQTNNIVMMPTASCNTVNVSQDMIRLLQNIKDISKVTSIAGSGSGSGTGTGTGLGNGYPEISAMPSSSVYGPLPRGNNGKRNNDDEVDFSVFESKLGDLSKYAQASQNDIRDRIKTLPKIQQGKELAKVNRFYEMLKAYQDYDPTKDKTGEDGQKILGELYMLVAGPNAAIRINFDELVLSTTKGLKVDSLRQRGIASSIEQLLSQSSSGVDPSAEGSRAMAKYNKYKNAMGQLAQKQFESRLDKQFKEFENQIKFISSREGGKANDIVAEGQIRNLIRHCTLLQEIYDPKLEGRMPKQCEKLGCGDANKMNWFKPQASQSNFSNYKSGYCDKSMSFKKIEDDYVKALNDKNGARICGKKIEEFF